MSSTLIPAVRDRYVMMPGSMSPDRVPITSPSIGVRPIDVSTGLPPTIADAEAPLPRCSTIWLSDSSGVCQERRRLLADVLVRGAVEPVAANVPLPRDIPVDRVGRRGGRQVVEERGVEDGDVRQVGQRPAGHPDAEHGGRVVQRRQRRELLQLRDQRVVDQRRLGTGPGRRARRGGRPRPIPGLSSGCPDAASCSNATCRAAAWSATGPSPIRSTIPSATIVPESGSTTAYFNDDEPELTTSTVGDVDAITGPAPGWR